MTRFEKIGNVQKLFWNKHFVFFVPRFFKEKQGDMVFIFLWCVVKYPLTVPYVHNSYSFLLLFLKLYSAFVMVLRCACDLDVIFIFIFITFLTCWA